MEKNTLTEQEKKFCLMFVGGPAPYSGNDVKCYNLIFNKSTEALCGQEEINVTLAARELMVREDVRAYIEELNAASIVSATTLRPRLTQTLLKIMDECSEAQYEDKFGQPLSPAALRAVAVNAASKLTEMYGIKEDIAHKVMLEGADGEGITFNLIAPQPATKSEENNDDIVG